MYFKNLPDGVNEEESVKDFKQELDKKYCVNYGTFNNIDAIKLSILLNLKKQEMDFVKIEVKDNICLVDGTPVLHLDNVAD